MTRVEKMVGSVEGAVVSDSLGQTVVRVARSR